MSDVFDAHRFYLSDDRRLRAFRAAIERVVRPGDVVADIGTGTGVLAMMACDAGAARVYAIDRHPLVEVARKIVRVNGYADRIQLIHGDSLQAAFPEPVDVVVSDLIGPFAFDSGIFDVLCDARRRFLKPAGLTIPSSIALHVAAVECLEIRAGIGFWRERPGGFDMGPAYEHARKSNHYVTVPPEALLTPPISAGTHGFGASGVPTIRARSTAHATRAGLIDAVAGWFEAMLAPEVYVSNAPGASDRLVRRNLVLPISEPLSVEAGDEITVDVHVLCHDQVCRWSVECRDRTGSRRRFSGSTFEGLLLSREDLEGRPAVRV